MIYTQVNPESLINPEAGTPTFGRGAWTRRGIEFDYRYALNPVGQPRIGSVAERSLDHWAVAAGCYAIQSRLVSLGHMAPVADGERGLFGPRTKAAVQAFQKVTKDPEYFVSLVVDGTVGKSDARALFTPLIDAAESAYHIPDRFLLGETNHESRLDPGAVGYYIFYPDYRGVDRSVSQINSKYNMQVTWADAYNVKEALDWSGRRLRKAYDSFKIKYPFQALSVLWDAALCNHNNPSAANLWAKTGSAPTPAAAKYVFDTKEARY